MNLPGMLLIGASGRKSGKTEFAAKILGRFKNDGGLVAVKATAIDKRDGGCPRGGKGCGVCSSLAGDYMIAEETDLAGTKDTSRFLVAGASRVLWLRVLKSRMREGVSALVETIGPDSAWLCESNSIRNVARPGVFVMVEHSETPAYKRSAELVRRHADCITRMDPASGKFDFDFSRLHLNGGRWTLMEDATAIVLAGGESRRMGTNKSLLLVRGRPMIQHVTTQLEGHFREVLISAGNGGDYEFLGLPVVADPERGRGPLMGIAAALKRSATDFNFITACDTPDIDMPFVRRMLSEAVTGDYDAVVPRRKDGMIQPLFAVYRRSVVPIIEALLKSGEGRIRALFERCRAQYVDVPDATDLVNLNTREEYYAYCARSE